MASLLKFQEHRRICLPIVLGGLGISKDKKKDAEGSEDQRSNPGQQQEGEHGKNLE